MRKSIIVLAIVFSSFSILSSGGAYAGKMECHGKDKTACAVWKKQQNAHEYKGPLSHEKARYCFLIRNQRPTAIAFRHGAGNQGASFLSFGIQNSKWRADPEHPGLVVREICTNFELKETFTICGDENHTVVHKHFFPQIKRERRVTACIAGPNNCS